MLIGSDKRGVRRSGKIYMSMIFFRLDADLRYDHDHLTCWFLKPFPKGPEQSDCRISLLRWGGGEKWKAD